MSKEMNVSLTHAAPPSPQAVARRALTDVPPHRRFAWKAGRRIAFPSRRFAFPGRRSAFPGPRFAFPGPRFVIPGRRFTFPGRRFVFPGLRFAFPGLRFAFPDHRFAFLAKRRGIAQGPAPASGPPRQSRSILMTLICSAQCVHRVCLYSAMH